MDRIPKVGDAPLTADQQAALKKLHDAAQQLEGVFIGMLFKEMHSTPQTSIFGKTTEAERTFSEMLDQKRADSLAQSGSIGIAKMMETQLRASVIGSATPLVAPGKAASAVPPAGAAPVVPPAALPPAPAPKAAASYADPPAPDDR